MSRQPLRRVFVGTPSGTSRWRARARLTLVAVVVLLCVAGVSLLVISKKSSTRPNGCVDLPSAPACAARNAQSPFVGTLNTDASTAKQESRAGVKMAMIEIGWRNFEPSQGHFDADYARRIREQVATYRSAGMEVTLGLGLHYTPQWVLDMPGSRLVNQYGTRSAQVDLIFNQDMRDLADTYLHKIDQMIGFDHFWAVRITGGGLSETLYPDDGTFWAFSDGAQDGSQRPKTIAPNPIPKWRPGVGDTTPSTSLRTKWLRWYVDGLADVASWQMRTLRSMGFTGYLQVITPGQGVRPSQIAHLVAAGLPNGLLGRGVVWSWLYADLKVRNAVTAYVSSLADGSGGDDHCEPGDVTTPLQSAAVLSWSATRWISRVAHQEGFTVAGEIPAFPSSAEGRAHYADSSSSGLAATAYAQAKSCLLLGMYWAHDGQVQDGAVGLSTLGRLPGADPRPPAEPAH